MIAVIKDMAVIEIRENIDFIPDENQTIVDISGIDPTPQVGWRIVGSDILPPFMSQTRPVGISLSNYVSSAITYKSISERKIFADQLIEKMKKLNIDNGLGIAQSLWVHQRLRKVTITVGEAHALAFPPLLPVVGMTFDIDLLNLVITGDIETAYSVLLCAEPDPMTDPYHALSAEMIGWIMQEIAVYLGWV